MHAIERRITALEVRLSDVEGPYGDTLYKLRRAIVKDDLRWSKVLDRMAVPDVTDAEVDAALDAE